MKTKEEIESKLRQIIAERDIELKKGPQDHATDKSKYLDGHISSILWVLAESQHDKV